VIEHSPPGLASGPSAPARNAGFRAKGSGERPIERSTAEKVCRLIAEDALGHQRARSASIAFAADEPVLLRDVHAVIETLCGADGWTALRRRAE
jgi:hypothetical protein